MQTMIFKKPGRVRVYQPTRHVAKQGSVIDLRSLQAFGIGIDSYGLSLIVFKCWVIGTLLLVSKLVINSKRPTQLAPSLWHIQGDV